MTGGLRVVFLDEDDARRAAEALRLDGHRVTVRRARFAGEDDDEDQPWGLVTDASADTVEPLAEQHGGWVERAAPAPPTAPRPPDLPRSPVRTHRSVGGSA